MNNQSVISQSCCVTEMTVVRCRTPDEEYVRSGSLGTLGPYSLLRAFVPERARVVVGHLNFVLNKAGI